MERSRLLWPFRRWLFFMSQSDPRSRSILWFAVANQALFLVVVSVIIWRLTGSLWIGLAGWALVAVWLRWIRSILLAPYRQGLRLIEEERFNEAAAAFEQGYRFFERFSFVDTFRAILLLSPSRMGYRELGLTNLGYAYLRAGEREKAKGAFERLQREFPHSRAAGVGLRQLAALELIRNEPNSNDETTS